MEITGTPAAVLPALLSIASPLALPAAQSTAAADEFQCPFMEEK